MAAAADAPLATQWALVLCCSCGQAAVHERCIDGGVLAPAAAPRRRAAARRACAADAAGAAAPPVRAGGRAESAAIMGAATPPTWLCEVCRGAWGVTGSGVVQHAAVT